MFADMRRFSLVMVTLLLTGFAGFCQSGQEDYVIKKIEINDVKTPGNVVGTHPAAGQAQIDKDWVEFLVEYEALPMRKTKPMEGQDFTPELTFNFMVGVVDPAKKASSGKVWYEPYTLLNGKVTYLNVYDGKKKYAAMYLHPSVVRRFGGVKAFKDKKNAFVFVEIMADGVRKTFKANDPDVEKDTAWQRAIAPENGLLLDKNQTPFSSAWWDVFDMIKVEPSR